MAVVVGEAAVRIRAEADPKQIEDDSGGPILDALGKVGGKGAALLGGLLGGAALGSSFLSAMENEALGDKLNAQLGASGQYAEDLGAVAGELYAGAYGENLGEVNEALRSVVQSGAVMEDATNEQLKSVTASAMDLASAFDQDVAGTAQAAGRMVQTGLAGSAEEAFDILTRGFQQGADTGGDFLDVLNEYGTTFTELGLSGATATGLIDQALAAGIPNADFAADALREIGIIGREGGEEAAEALDSLGLSAETYFANMQAGGPQAEHSLGVVLDALRNTEDPALRAAAATALVGTQYEDLGDAILQMDPTTAAAGLGEIEGAAAKMGDTLNDNASANLLSFGRQAQQLATDFLGGQLLPMVSSVASTLATEFGPAVEQVGAYISDTVIPAVRSMAEWITANQTPLLIVAGIIASVFLPHLIALGVQSLIASAKSLIAWGVTQAGAIAAAATHSLQVLKMVAGWVLLGAQSLIQAARVAGAWLIAMGPIGLVIAAVIGLVALIVIYFDEIVAAIGAAWEWVKSAAQETWDWIKGAVSAALDFLVDLFMNFTLVGLIIQHWDSIKEAFTAGIDAVVSFVTELPGKIGSALASFGQTLWDLATSAWAMFDSAVDTAVQAVITYVTEFPGNFVAGLANLGSMLGSVASSAWQWFMDNVISKAGEAISWIGGLPGRIVGGLGNLGGLLVSKGRELIQGLVDGIAGAASFVGNVAKNVVNSVIGFVNANVIDGINDLLEFKVAGITINPPDIPRIPRLHSGGRFDSGVAAGEGLALLRDQELVVTPEQEATANQLLANLFAGNAPAGQAGGAPNITIHENVYASPGEPVDAIAARTTQSVVWNLNGGLTRRFGAEVLGT